MCSGTIKKGVERAVYRFEKIDKKLLGEQIEDELMNFILQEPCLLYTSDAADD